MDTPKIRRALLSVHDKTGLLELARALAAYQVELTATGGTAAFLQSHDLAVTPIERLTGFPEILGGRVKTLHPRILGGLLARRDDEAHLQEAAKHGIALIDLVVVNLYPFRREIARPDCTLAQALEQIDIGGVALLRAAAKNFPHVAVLTRPEQYAPFVQELSQGQGALSPATREELAAEAFAYTAAYDAAIHAYLQRPETSAPFPQTLVLALDKAQDLRYGENPHQRAAFYREPIRNQEGWAGAKQLQGKELSFNNLADADAAWGLVERFHEPGCVIVKHANPCGVGLGESPALAYQKARATDPAAAFGGIVACNHEIDGETAALIAELFTEVVLAPAYTAEARHVFATKKNLRLLEMSSRPPAAPAGLELKRAAGGVLVQERDPGDEDFAGFRSVTLRQASADEAAALKFGWQVVQYVKSNAIVLCSSDRTLGIGAGQMSRIDAVRLALGKAREAGLPLAGAVLASDAFFPFPDGIEAAAKAGITAVIQPGGALRDEEVVAAADRHGMAMIFTGVRHFRH